MKKWVVVTVILALWLAAGAAAYAMARRGASEPDLVRSMAAVPGVSGVVHASWSPDGDRILCESFGISIINQDGTGYVYLGEGREPAWSPDGTRVAVVSDNGIDVVGADAAGRRLLVGTAAIAPAENDHASLESPAWSPDGSQIAFNLSTFVYDDPVLQGTGTGYSSIWVVNSDGSNPRRLTTCSGYETCPSWSRDGQSIRFYSDRDGDGPSAWTCRVNGGEPEPAEEWGVSPDGTRIAWIDEDADLWLKDADGGHEVEVASSRTEDYRNPTWSPDGSLLAFDSTVVGPVGNIWVVNADGTGKTRLTGAARNSYDCSPEWIQYREPQWSPDGARLLFLNAFSTGDSTRMDRLWVLELDLDQRPD